MLKGLKFQSLTMGVGALFAGLLLCSAQTAMAEEKTAKPADHAGASQPEAERAAPTIEEKLRTILDQAPSPLLVQINKALAAEKPDLSAEEFKAAIDAAVKKLGEDQAAESDTVVAELKKAFEDGRDALGEKPGAQITSAVVDELERRLDKPTPPSEEPTKPGKPSDNADNKDKPKPSALEEEFKKQLADFQKGFEKLKEKQKEDEKKAKDAKLAELLKGLEDKGKGGGAGADTGGGKSSGGGGSPGGQPSDTGGEEEPPAQAQQPTAGDKLRELADLINQGTQTSDASEAPAEEEEEGSASKGEEPEEDDSLLTDLASNDTSEPEPAVETPTQPMPQPEMMGPPQLPAKTQLPVIADERRLPSVPESQLGGNPQGMLSGNGSSVSNNGGTSFSDGAFAVGGGQTAGPQKKITYKYSRTGPETYTNGTGSNAEGSVSSDGSYSSSSSYTSKAMVGGIPAIFDTDSNETTAAIRPVAQTNVPVFDYVGATLNNMCTNGSLSCSTSTEKQQ